MHIKMERRGMGAQIANQITFKGRQLYIISPSQDNFKCHKHICKPWQLLESLREYHIYLVIRTSKLLVITNQTRAELSFNFPYFVVLLPSLGVKKRDIIGITSSNKNLLCRKSKCDFQKAVKTVWNSSKILKYFCNILMLTVALMSTIINIKIYHSECFRIIWAFVNDAQYNQNDRYNSCKALGNSEKKNRSKLTVKTDCDDLTNVFT